MELCHVQPAAVHQPPDLVERLVLEHADQRDEGGAVRRDRVTTSGSARAGSAARTRSQGVGAELGRGEGVFATREPADLHARES